MFVVFAVYEHLLVASIRESREFCATWHSPGKAVARTYFKKPIENLDKAIKALSSTPCSILEETVACKTGLRPSKERQYNIRNTVFNTNLPVIDL